MKEICLSSPYLYMFVCRFQAFYTKFYSPEKELFPQEIENTDKLARALVVRDNTSLFKLEFLNLGFS